MPESFPFYTKISKRMKNVSLRFDTTTGQVVVCSRKEISDRDAQKLIYLHRDWVSKQYEKYLASKNSRVKLDDGTEISLMGEKWIIKYQHVFACGRPRTLFEKEIGTIEVHADSKHRPALLTGLKSFAKKQLTERLALLASEEGFSYKTVQIRDQSSRWGSCSSSGNISLNWRLIFAPLAVIDYVIMHELAHTKEMNHSSRFWNLVNSSMPDYKEAKKWLKLNGATLRFA